VPARLIEYPQGLAAALSGPDMQRALYLRMRKAEAYAKFISPYRTGRYSRSFVIIVGVRGNPPRAYARLLNHATDPVSGYPYCLALEFGTRYMRRQRILGRAADALRQV
jgi:hypothetical protein